MLWVIPDATTRYGIALTIFLCILLIRKRMFSIGKTIKSEEEQEEQRESQEMEEIHQRKKSEGGKENQGDIIRQCGRREGGIKLHNRMTIVKNMVIKTKIDDDKSTSSLFQRESSTIGRKIFAFPCKECNKQVTLTMQRMLCYLQNQIILFFRPPFFLVDSCRVHCRRHR